MISVECFILISFIRMVSDSIRAFITLKAIWTYTSKSPVHFLHTNHNCGSTMRN
jgi:hypothetical protein